MTTEQQLDAFRKGFPWMKIVSPAKVGRGIESLDEAARREAAAYAETAQVAGKVKFVPASGAASRMFKQIFAGMENPNDASRRLCAEINRFAFYDKDLFGAPDPDNDADCRKTAETLLTDKGLGYGSKPKGVLRFHRYPDEVRTALAEHLVEGQEYMRDADGTVRLVFTVSPEHRELFEKALEEVRGMYEKRYGVHYDVRFVFQDPATDTIAVTPDNKPFLLEDGTVLRRPAGHGALIYNLNDIDEELVCIKNIDNVAVERLLPLTAEYKKVLMGRALQLRDRIFYYLEMLDRIAATQPYEPYPNLPGYNALRYDAFATDEAQALCREIEDFLYSELCIEMPVAKDCRSRADALRAKLNRPIRVCGMVRNTGEPGGGPFIIKDRDGCTSLQILEGAQIDKDDPSALAALAAATHFNPVDIVCCLHDYRGNSFDLPAFVDPDAGFISSKSYKGRELKALELPGLWNGSMSDWNTLFVEVPVETFNPVKEVLDLLRPAHQN